MDIIFLKMKKRQGLLPILYTFLLGEKKSMYVDISFVSI